MPVIEVHGLRKEYRRLRGGKTVAVEGLDMAVPAGGVFGFLGPNGSGKTTTIRCLLGLARATGGETRLLGAAPDRLHTVIRRVGALVETPTFFPTFSGKRNLELLGRLYGIGPSRVQETLERVGLGDRGGDMFRTYSLGMKQRLGIASVLLKDPEVLILDEPANGLDPAGIKEVRELLRSLGTEGRTVFVSSHLLSEVQQMCDHVVIISRGRHIRSGPVHDVLRGERAQAVVVRVPDAEKAIAALGKAGFEAMGGDGIIRVTVDPADAGRVTQALARARIYLTEMRPFEMDLETVFLELTSEADPVAEATP